MTRAAELCAVRRRPSAVRYPPHRGGGGAVALRLANRGAQSAAHMVAVGARRVRAADLRAICRRPGTVRDPRHSGGGWAVTVRLAVRSWRAPGGCWQPSCARRWPGAERCPQHRGWIGAVTVSLAVPIAQRATHTNRNTIAVGARLGGGAVVQARRARGQPCAAVLPGYIQGINGTPRTPRGGSHHPSTRDEDVGLTGASCARSATDNAQPAQCWRFGWVWEMGCLRSLRVPNAAPVWGGWRVPSSARWSMLHSFCCEP